MPVVLRLSRMGNNNNPFFRVVAQDSRVPGDGRYIEGLGWYDPKVDGVNYRLKMDRVSYWLDNGALVSDTVKSLIKKARNAPPPAAEEPAAAEPGVQEPAATTEEPAPEPAPAETSEASTPSA